LLSQKPKLSVTRQFFLFNLIAKPKILSEMQYPIRKLLLAATLAMGSFAFTTAAHSNKDQKNITASANSIPAPVAPAPAPAPAASTEAAKELYSDLHLEEIGMHEEVFDMALKGFNKLEEEGKIPNADKITIVDFSQPSSQKRLYVIDLDKKEILFQSLVSHGRGTGELWAKSFSNQASSYKSSPGFYVTEETYTGHNGYSLRLDGLEKGINDNARNRSIVMHGAPYVSESAIQSLGFLGRSQGCPAIPLALHKPIINTIKDGTCLFIYTPDESYVDHSELLN